MHELVGYSQTQIEGGAALRWSLKNSLSAVIEILPAGYSKFTRLKQILLVDSKIK